MAALPLKPLKQLTSYMAVLTTGNELIMPGQPLPPGAIYNSNRHTLRGLVQATGSIPADLGIVPDDLDSTRAALRRAAQDHDLIITSGCHEALSASVSSGRPSRASPQDSSAATSRSQVQSVPTAACSNTMILIIDVSP